MTVTQPRHHISILVISAIPQKDMSSRSSKSSDVFTPPKRSLNVDFDGDSPKKKPKFDQFRSTPSIKSEPTEVKKPTVAKKEEVLIRKMVVKTDGEEFLYSFLLFNSYKLKASIDGMGDTQYCLDNKCQGNINASFI